MRVFFLCLLFILTAYCVSGQRTFYATFGGYNYSNTKNILNLSDSNVYIAEGSRQFKLIKISRNNKIEFEKILDDDAEFAYAIKTADSCFILAGTTRRLGRVGSNDRIYLIKLNSLGDVKWSIAVGNRGTYSFDIRHVSEDSVGNLLVTGAIDERLFVTKLDKNGKLIWGYTYFGHNDPKSSGIAIKEIPGKGYISLGEKKVNDSIYPHIMYLDYNGDTLWTKSFIKSNSSQDFIVTKDKGFIILISQKTLIKYDSTGNLQWKKNINGQRIQLSKILLSGNDYILSGTIFFHPNHMNGLDALLMKLDENCNLKWARFYNLFNGDKIHDVIPKDNGYMILANNNTGYTTTGLIQTDSTGKTYCSRTLDNDLFSINDSNITSAYTTFGSKDSFGYYDYVKNIPGDQDWLERSTELCHDYNLHQRYLVSPSDANCLDSLDVSVNFADFSIQSITKFKLNYIINDTMKGSFDWSGKPPIITITFGKIYLPVGKHNFKIWASELNGENDQYPYDDTLNYEIFILAPTIAEITTTDSVIFCEGEKARLHANKGMGHYYQWFRNGELVQDSNTPFYDAATEGEYQVQVINNIGCSKLSEVVTLKVNTIPDKPTISKISKKGNNIESSSLSGNQWYINNKIIPNATNKIYQIKESGYYKVTVTDSFNCTNASDTYYFNWVGVEEESFTKFNIYPNPANEVFFADGIYGMNYVLTDLTGKTLLEGKYENGIMIQHLSAGTYILKVNSKDKIYHARIIVAR